MRSYLLLGLAFGVSVLGIPQPLAAQAGETVEGRVYEVGTDLGIQNAVVSLDGSGSTLTDADGRYRIIGVQPGRYRLTVRVIGYSAHEQIVQVVGETTIDIGLEVNPIALDSVEARVRRVTVRGTAEDTVLDFRLVDAEVTTDLGHIVRTDSHGGFELQGVYERLPFRLRIRAFGYLPFEDEIIPYEGREYRFAL